MLYPFQEKISFMSVANSRLMLSIQNGNIWKSYTSLFGPLFCTCSMASSGRKEVIFINFWPQQIQD